MKKLTPKNKMRQLRMLKKNLKKMKKRKEKKEIYYHRYSGLVNAIMGKSSWFRPKV